jgi:hypothetical protein
MVITTNITSSSTTSIKRIPSSLSVIYIRKREVKWIELQEVATKILFYLTTLVWNLILQHW